MGSPITEEDVAFIRHLKALGILLPVDPTKPDYSNGITPVICADGDQRKDIEGHLEGLMRKAGCNERLHALKLNGGAASIALDDRMNPGDHKGQSFLMDIGGTSLPDVKGIRTVGLYGHWPCGLALLVGVSLEECFELLMRGETRVKDHYPDLPVDSYFHVDFGPSYKEFGKKRQKMTYFASHRAWRAWTAEKNRIRLPGENGAGSTMRIESDSVTTVIM